MTHFRKHFAAASLLVFYVLLPVNSFAGGLLEWGGSNYVAIGLNLSSLNNPVDWQNSDIFKTVACTFDANQKRLREDLSSMRANGQRKIALVLWHTNTDSTNDCNGFLLRSYGGSFSPRVMHNIVQFLKVANDLGFDEVQIRFAPLGKLWPKEWAIWSEALFHENWSLINSTVSALQSVNSPGIVYDLGVELGGLTAPGCVQCPRYVARMWQAYTSEFGKKNTYGFSMAYAPGRFSRLVDNLRESGELPDYYAIDLYEKPDQTGMVIDILAKEAARKDIILPIFIIQETYYADVEVYQALVAAAKRNQVQLKAIMQWPQTRGSNRRHISVPETPDYIYYPSR